MTISIEEDIANDLINSKIGLIDQEISEIIERWGFSTANQFIEDCRQGKLEECENDAMDLVNLLDYCQKLNKILSDVK